MDAFAVGSAAEALKQILASEERRDSRGVKRRAGELEAGTADGKKSKVLEVSAAPRAETGVSRPEPDNGKSTPVTPSGESAEPATAEITLPAIPIKSLSLAGGAKVIASHAAHNDPPKPATPLKAISTPVQPKAQAANPGTNPWPRAKLPTLSHLSSAPPSAKRPAPEGLEDNDSRKRQRIEKTCVVPSCMSCF